MAQSSCNKTTCTCSTGTTPRKIYHRKDGFVNVSLCKILDIIECAYEIPSTRTVATDTESDDLIATAINIHDLEVQKLNNQFENSTPDMKCNVENNEIISSRLDQIEFTDTDDSFCDNWEDIISGSSDYCSTMHQSSSDETEYLSSSAQILIEEFKFILQEMQQDSSKSPYSTAEDKHSKDFLIWRIQRAINTLQSSIDIQEYE
ncbi:unnamed protein product [Rotaria sp. Silwood2]|nr:unnamed protein product [Rotaria sp. Silwood2]CAF2824458.1 unnamed protein product [Rotaria sp. Silwood2]CAF3201280.1 unnamed protein product [Rotaria sp. Silwood2]CAF3227707.1 unnamed protein product [Rotaria sp. Silwood2]CAF3911824.1 unnamed protein product [Rotaria sp. Silwood2]